MSVVAGRSTGSLAVMQSLRYFGAVIILASWPLEAADFGAIDVARRYSAAVLAYDCETMYALTSNRLKIRDKRPNETRDSLCGFVNLLRRDGITETLDPPRASLTDGDRKVVFVTAHREFGSVGRRRITTFDYVVHSSDGGRTWQVLDLGCVNERWIREIFPSYTGEPPVRAAESKAVELGK